MQKDQMNCWRSFSNSLAMAGTAPSSPDPPPSAELDRGKKYIPVQNILKKGVGFFLGEQKMSFSKGKVAANIRIGCCEAG